MPRLTLTRDLAWAAALDAGNRAANGKPWSEDDYNQFWRTFDSLWPPCKDGWPTEKCAHCQAKAAKTEAKQRANRLLANIIFGDSHV